MMNFEARLLETLDNLEPLCPIRINQDVDLMGLEKKRGMPDPGDTNLAGLHPWKERPRGRAGTFREQRRDPNAGDEITLRPIATRTQFNSRRLFRVTRRSLANYLALSRKRIRHSRGTI